MPEIAPDPQLSKLPLQPELNVGGVLGGKYLIDGVLGEGGMGVVLSATHLELQAPVAIKVVREEHARNEEVVSRMLFEARAAAKLRSSHVVRVIDVARLPSGAPYIVMEHLVGRDLATVLIERGALPIQEAVDYVLQACEGLAEAHALGIIHRDLKPENLFLADTPEGVVVKILDFGISKEVGGSVRLGPRTALTSAGCAVGSPFYMSPEQMRASPKVDTRADIWSLGAILFELLTSRCPFEGDTVPVVYASVLGDPAPALRSLAEHAPEELDVIVQRCLQKEAASRYADVAALVSALREFASADGQRAIDRSARLASGINLKNDRSITALAPSAVPEKLTACSSPTLQSVSNNTPAPRLAVAHSSPALRSAHRRWAIVASAAAIILIGGALALWQRESMADATPVTAAAVRETLPAVPALAATPALLAIEPAMQATILEQPAAPELPASAPRVAHSAKTGSPRVARGGATKPVPASSPPVALAEPVRQGTAEPKQSPFTADTSDIAKLGGRY